jgi:carbonic anhydrase/acetyltransferase-like protein (isoleucine patch superfamily)
MDLKSICTHLFNSPDIHPAAYVAPGAVVLGDVTLGDRASVWYQCVLRADIERIIIGEGTNIQDGSVIHLASELGTTVGSYVTVGHKALLHACEVEDEVLVGMGAIVMDGARIGARSIVAAGSLVTKGMQVPTGSLVMGSPARVVRSLSLEEQGGIRHWAEKYIAVAAAHREFHGGSTSAGESAPDRIRD